MRSPSPTPPPPPPSQSYTATDLGTRVERVDQALAGTTTLFNDAGLTTDGTIAFDRNGNIDFANINVANSRVFNANVTLGSATQKSHIVVEPGEETHIDATNTRGAEISVHGSDGKEVIHGNATLTGSVAQVGFAYHAYVNQATNDPNRTVNLGEFEHWANHAETTSIQDVYGHIDRIIFGHQNEGQSRDAIQTNEQTVLDFYETTHLIANPAEIVPVEHVQFWTDHLNNGLSDGALLHIFATSPVGHTLFGADVARDIQTQYGGQTLETDNGMSLDLQGGDDHVVASVFGDQIFGTFGDKTIITGDGADQIIINGDGNIYIDAGTHNDYHGAIAGDVVHITGNGHATVIGAEELAFHGGHRTADIHTGLGSETFLNETTDATIVLDLSGLQNPPNIDHGLAHVPPFVEKTANIINFNADDELFINGLSPEFSEATVLLSRDGTIAFNFEKDGVPNHENGGYDANIYTSDYDLAHALLQDAGLNFSYNPNGDQVRTDVDIETIGHIGFQPEPEIA